MNHTNPLRGLVALAILAVLALFPSCSTMAGGAVKTNLRVGADIGDAFSVRVDVDTRTVYVRANVTGHVFVDSTFTQGPIIEGFYEAGDQIVLSEVLEIPRTKVGANEPLPALLATIPIFRPPNPNYVGDVAKWGLTFEAPAS